MSTDTYTVRRFNRVRRESSRRTSTRTTLRNGDWESLETFGPTRTFRTGVEA